MRSAISAVETEQSPLGCENLPSGHVLVEPASWSATPIENRTSSAWATTSSPPTQALPGGFEQGGEHPDHRGLPGAVGAEKAVDLAGSDVEIDAVDRREVAEGAAKAFGFHGCSMGVLMAANLAARETWRRESSRRLAG